jgi:hypothetical protein
MKSIRTFVLGALPAVFLLALLLGDSRPVAAADGELEHCQSLRLVCCFHARFRDDALSAMLAFFECDYEHLNCVRRHIVGR